ncbi:methylthioribose kinase [Methylacidiphilum caldifontis]|uniref:Methylthioribose kinase n=1 Tax=Methylacidiphilum caldifontis TaxID=2795386 RepID=A0A4Y8PHC8_9BACT|nr:methylthioribose kinase [Methylacidiphilum caldifontis]TFE72054.1 methylthioribose kinase [Methylacidiphilum caldifontis]
MVFSPLVSNQKNKRVPKDVNDWEKNFPDLFLLEEQLPKIEIYLKKIHFLGPKETILSLSTCPAPCIDKSIRVITSQRTFILKQSRPWIECCPSSRAPLSRIFKEAEFYTICSKDSFLKAYVPSLLFVDSTNYLLILSDIGEKNFPAIDENNLFSIEELDLLLEFLSYLHHTFYKKKLIVRFENQAMRKYHWRNLFITSMKAKKTALNSKDDETIYELKRKFLADWNFYSAMKHAGFQYLDQGPTLIHGNFLPSSWIRTETGVGIINFESMICGRPEIDLGLLLAHLLLLGLTEHFLHALNHYKQLMVFDTDFAFRIAGVEIFRQVTDSRGTYKILSAQLKENLLWTSYKLLIERKIPSQFLSNDIRLEVELPNASLE